MATDPEVDAYIRRSERWPGGDGLAIMQEMKDRLKQAKTSIARIEKYTAETLEGRGPRDR